MSENETRLVVLTDGRQNRPVKVKTGDCTLSSLQKEAKNKLRKKYKYVVYETESQQQQWVRTDENLREVLHHRSDGPLTLLFTNNEPDSFDDFVITEAKRGLSFIIGNKEDTEDGALAQLKNASELQGCIFAIGMPDLHPGKGIPIGAVVMTDSRVAYPQLVDNDIGCGMSFVETSLQKLSASKVRKIANALESIDGPYASHEAMMELCSQRTKWGSRSLDPLPTLESFHYEKLGTVGGGNHFAELQEFHEIMDGEAIERHGIDTSKIHLLVHSGSRSLGSTYLSLFCEQASKERAAQKGSPKHGHFAADSESPMFQEYLQNHNVALNFAARNRKLIAQRLLEQISGDSSEPNCKFDIYHNFLEHIRLDSYDALLEMTEQGPFPKDIPPLRQVGSQSRAGWIHRKGATPTTQSPFLVIPGSRGSLSYLVEVNAQVEHGSGYSLAHGAGRKMNRSKALKLHQGQYPNSSQLLQTDLGGVVVCDKKELVYEEAPGSYKNIDLVVQGLTDVGITVENQRQGLIRVLATLRPLLTYKYKNPYAPK